MLPSTFCMSWWMWPFRIVTEPKRLSIASACNPVIGSPAPSFIDEPERDVSEHHDRRRRSFASQVVVQPGELLGPEIAKAAGLQIEHVHKPDEVDAAMVEAVPAPAPAALAVAVQVGLPL